MSADSIRHLADRNKPLVYNDRNRKAVISHIRCQKCYLADVGFSTMPQLLAQVIDPYG